MVSTIPFQVRTILEQVDYPKYGANYPVSGSDYLGADVDYPEYGANLPVSGSDYPGAGVDYPEYGVNYPDYLDLDKRARQSVYRKKLTPP
jgi:hypothetical protein